MARDSSSEMTCGLTNVLLEFGLLCADDGSQHLMYFSVSVRVFHQQLWLANGSWRLARSLTNVLFGDTLHRLLMTDCGSYMYFSVLWDCCYSFFAPY